MSDSLREAMPKLPKRESDLTWKPKLPKGVISQDSFHSSRVKKMSFKPR